MANTSVFGMNILPTLDKQGMAKVTRAVKEGLAGNILDATTVRGFETMAKNSAKEFTSTIAKAKLVGLHAAADDWRKTMLRTEDDIVKAIKEMEKTKEQYAKEGRMSEYAAYQRKIKDELQARGEMLAMEMKGVEKIIEKRQKALEDWEGKKAGEVGQAMGEGFGDAMSDMWSNVKSKDLGGLAKALQGTMKSAQGGLASAGAAGVGGEAAAGAMTSAAGALGSAAAALGVIAGIVVAIGAVVAVMIEADNQAKEFNSTLLQGASQADFFTQQANDGVMDLTDNLGAARKAAIGLAWEFRGDAKEIAGVIAAANEAGLTFKEMEAATGNVGDATAAYTQVAKTAIVHSKTLGQSMNDIAVQSADWLHDLGGNMSTVESGFKSIFQGAMQSGIGVKRFYGMVTAATANMALYNIRIEEAAALISNLGDSLGEANAASFTEGLSKGFAAESYTERFKRLMIAGQGDMTEIMENSAVHTAEAFKKKFGAEGSESLAAAAGEMGIDLKGAVGGDTDALKALGQASEKSIRALLEATSSGGERRELEKLIEVSRGMTGGLSDQAKALDAMSQTDKLATVLSGGLGGKAISEMSAKSLAAFEQYAGISGEQLTELRKVDRQLRGQYEASQDIRDTLARGETLSADQVAKLDTLGLEIGANGKLFVKGTDKQVDSFNDYVQSQGHMLEAAMETAMTDSEALAHRQAEDTTSILNQLDTGIAYILEDIYDVMQQLLSWTMGLTAEEVATRDALVGQLRTQEGAFVEELRENSQELAAARDLAKTTKGEERDAAEAQIALLEGERETIEQGLDAVRMQVQKAGTIESAWFGDKSADDMAAEATSFTTGEIKARLDPDQLKEVAASGDTAVRELLQSQGYSGGESQDEVRAIMEGIGATEGMIRQQLTGMGTARAEGEFGSASGMVSTDEAQAALDAGFTRRSGGVTRAGAATGAEGFAIKSVSDVAQGKSIGSIGYDAESMKEAALSGELTTIGIDKLLEQELISEQLAEELKTLETEHAKKALEEAGRTTDAVEEGTRTRVDDQVKALELADMRDIARAASGGGANQGRFDMVMEALQAGDGQDVATVLASQGHGADSAAMRKLADAGYVTGVDDFIYRGGASGGLITPINAADELLGAKPGGPVDKALGAGGGSNMFTFHINGGDTAKVYAVVKKALRESGVRPPPGTG